MNNISSQLKLRLWRLDFYNNKELCDDLKNYQALATSLWVLHHTYVGLNLLLTGQNS